MPHLLAEIAAAMLHTLTLASAGAWVIGYFRTRKSISSLKEPEPCPDPPTASVIIPARNAAETIGKVIESVLAQDIGEGLREVIVVDDGSTDKTPDIVRGYGDPRLRYVRIDSTPAGWSPKNWACWVGAGKASGDILIFLDADTWFLRADALRALACAARGYGIASMAPRFLCPTRRCRAVETALTTFSHAFLGFERVSDPGHSLAWFYGCCWGVERGLYERFGGHASVKAEIVEDKAIAKLLKRRGVIPAVLKGFDHVETLWYGGVSETVSTLGRVLHSYGSSTGKALGASLAVGTAYISPLLEALLAPYTGLLALAIAVVSYVPQVVAHGVGAGLNRYWRGYALTSPVFGLVLSAGLVKAVMYSRKGVRWRGRRLSFTS